MLNTNLTTQFINTIPTKKLSSLPVQKSMAEIQTQKNNVSFTGSTASLALASNFKAGLNINRQMLTFKGDDDDENIETETKKPKLTPKQRRTAMATMLILAEMLSPSSSKAFQSDPYAVNEDMVNCTQQAFINQANQKQQFNDEDLNSEMNRICPDILSAFEGLPNNQQEAIIENINKTINTMQEQLTHQTIEQQRQQKTTTRKKSQIRTRSAQLPPSYKPHFFMPNMALLSGVGSPELMASGKRLIESQQKKRESINTCLEDETQERCNQRALQQNLLEDRASLPAQPNSDYYNSNEGQRNLEKQRKVEADNERMQKEIMDSRIQRMKINP